MTTRPHHGDTTARQEERMTIQNTHTRLGDPPRPFRLPVRLPTVKYRRLSALPRRDMIWYGMAWCSWYDVHGTMFWVRSVWYGTAWDDDNRNGQTSSTPASTRRRAPWPRSRRPSSGTKGTTTPTRRRSSRFSARRLCSESRQGFWCRLLSMWH